MRNKYSKYLDCVNILSIDGGGIRGVLPAQILIYVEEKLSKLYKKDVKLSDHFDYVTGTSTGGILGALYCFPDENGDPIASSTIALSAGAVGLGLDTTKDGTQTRITNIDGTITQDQVSDVQGIPSGRKSWSILR